MQRRRCMSYYCTRPVRVATTCLIVCFLFSRSIISGLKVGWSACLIHFSPYIFHYIYIYIYSACSYNNSLLTV